MYFSFFKNKKILPAPELLVDVHSHLIPGIDDGARDMDESLSLLHALEAQGYQKVITTPHIMIDTYCNTSENIMQGLNILSSVAKEKGIKLQIEAAAEYYLDEGFLKHLHSPDLLTIGGEYVLFETSYMAKPLQFDEILFEIISAGYKPLFAHPERYRYIHNLEKEYSLLKDKGVYFQVNINSFGGHYGKEAKRKADFLNKKGMIDFLGSDTHHIKQVQMLTKIKQSKVYHTLFEHNTILNNIL